MSGKDDTYYTNCEKIINNINTETLENKLNTFRSSLLALDQQMPSVLEDYKQYYVFINKNPEYPDYQSNFANIQSNLTTIGSDYFTISNDVDASIDALNEKLICLNDLIRKEKDKNTTLKSRLGIVSETNNAAGELIYDYKQIYNEGYLRNWALFFSIIIAGFAIKNMYSNINGDMTTNVKNMASNMANNISNMGSNMKNMANDIYNRGANYRYNQ